MNVWALDNAQKSFPQTAETFPLNSGVSLANAPHDKAPEDRRSPKPRGFFSTGENSDRFWTAPVLWRYPHLFGFRRFGNEPFYEGHIGHVEPRSIVHEESFPGRNVL